MAHLIAGRYEKAIEWVDRSLREQPGWGVAVRTKIVSCAHLGRTEEAHELLTRLLELRPALTIAWFKAYVGRMVLPEVAAIFVEGLRKAGLAEE
jgi:tetratricopeptide (TPR) repeat protein